VARENKKEEKLLQDICTAQHEIVTAGLILFMLSIDEFMQNGHVTVGH
jgi:hypothetical protein